MEIEKNFLKDVKNIIAEYEELEILDELKAVKIYDRREEDFEPKEYSKIAQQNPELAEMYQELSETKDIWKRDELVKKIQAKIKDEKDKLPKKIEDRKIAFISELKSAKRANLNEIQKLRREARENREGSNNRLRIMQEPNISKEKYTIAFEEMKEKMKSLKEKSKKITELYKENRKIDKTIGLYENEMSIDDWKLKISTLEKEEQEKSDKAKKGGEDSVKKPAGEKPAGEKPAGEKPAGKKQPEKKTAGEKPAEKKLAGEKIDTEKEDWKKLEKEIEEAIDTIIQREQKNDGTKTGPVEKPAGEKTAEKKPAGEKTDTEKEDWKKLEKEIEEAIDTIIQREQKNDGTKTGPVEKTEGAENDRTKTGPGEKTEGAENDGTKTGPTEKTNPDNNGKDIKEFIISDDEWKKIMGSSKTAGGKTSEQNEAKVIHNESKTGGTDVATKSDDTGKSDWDNLKRIFDGKKIPKKPIKNKIEIFFDKKTGLNVKEIINGEKLNLNSVWDFFAVKVFRLPPKYGYKDLNEVSLSKNDDAYTKIFEMIMDGKKDEIAEMVDSLPEIEYKLKGLWRTKMPFSEKAKLYEFATKSCEMLKGKCSINTGWFDKVYMSVGKGLTSLFSKIQLLDEGKSKKTDEVVETPNNDAENKRQVIEKTDEKAKSTGGTIGHAKFISKMSTEKSHEEYALEGKKLAESILRRYEKSGTETKKNEENSKSTSSSNDGEKVE